MHTTTDTDSAIAEWLAGTLDDPASAHLQWRIRRLALLPLGERFTALRITAEVVHAAVSSTEPAIVSGVLSEALDGPVIHDPIGCRYYALTPADEAGWPPLRGSVLVGEGTWLGVPRLDQTVPQRGSYWSVPPAHARAVCDLARLAALVQEGNRLLAAQEPS